MTLGDDYEDEMTRFARLSDEEIEGLLDGTSTAPELADVASFVADLRSDATRQVDEARIVQYTQGAAVIAAAGAGSIPAGSQSDSSLTPGILSNARRRAPTVKLSSVRRKTAAVLSAATLLVGTTGVAFAANGAKPGDTLYGIDRALEVVGVGDGSGPERVSEIQALFDAGDLPRSLTHAAEVIPEVTGTPTAEATVDASDALAAAALVVKGAGSEVSAGTRLAVAELLDYLSLSLSDGHVDGAAVAKLARDISGRSQVGTAPGGPLADVPPGPPSETPVGPPNVTPVGPPAAIPNHPVAPPVPPVTPPDGSLAPPVEPPGPPAGAPGTSLAPGLRP